jgi:hypothetical protein
MFFLFDPNDNVVKDELQFWFKLDIGTKSFCGNSIYKALSQIDNIKMYKL